VFGLLVENFIENELYDETVSLYEDSITKKNGQDCDEDVLIIVILCLVMGEPKRAEQRMYELSEMYLPVTAVSRPSSPPTKPKAQRT
jgi:hypothetical protein